VRGRRVGLEKGYYVLTSTPMNQALCTKMTSKHTQGQMTNFYIRYWKVSLNSCTSLLFGRGEVLAWLSYNNSAVRCLAGDKLAWDKVDRNKPLVNSISVKLPVHSKGSNCTKLLIRIDPKGFVCNLCAKQKGARKMGDEKLLFFLISIDSRPIIQPFLTVRYLSPCYPI
jgi:hypothetical protein